MLLAFVYWLAEGKETLEIPLGANAALTLAVPPESVMATFSVSFEGDQAEEADSLDELNIDDPKPRSSTTRKNGSRSGS